MSGIATTGYQDLVNSLFTKVKPKFVETFKTQQLPLQRMTFQRGTSPFTGDKLSVPIRYDDAPSGQRVQLYQSSAAVVANYLVRMNAGPRFYVNKNLVWDEKERHLNSGAERAVHLYEMKVSAQAAAIVEDQETELALVPVNAADVANRLLGPLYWFPTLEAGVALNVNGGFVGDTVTFQDGTFTTTIGEVDRSDARYGRICNWAAHHEGVGPQLIRTLRRARNMTEFESRKGVRGEQTPEGQMPLLLMNTQTQEELEDMANRGPDDLQGQIARFKSPTIVGLRTRRVSKWDDLAYDPIVGINVSKWGGYVVGNKWMKEAPAQNMEGTHDVWVKPVDCHGQAMPDDIRTGGFTIARVR